MGWTVLSVAHRVVREHVENRQLHYCRKPNSRPGVVAEDKKGGAKRAELRERQSVHNRTHRVLADAKVQVLAIRRIPLKTSGTGQSGLVGRTKISGATEQPRDVLREDVQHLSRCLASSHSLRVGRESRKVTVPTGWEFALLHARSRQPAQETSHRNRRRVSTTPRERLPRAS